MEIIRVPKSCRTKIVEFKDAGVPGIKVTRKQLQEFSNIIGAEHIDEVIPLSGPGQPSVKACTVKHANSEDMIKHSVYWQTPDGSHGWCCDACGQVFQWG